jgi:hypothetical protein
MRFALLGPLAVTNSAGEQVGPAGPRQRVLLAARGDQQQARQAWQQALEILDDLQHPDADQVRDKLRSPS